VRGRLQQRHVLSTLVCEREIFLFTGTQFSNLYTAKENKTAVSGTAARTFFSQFVADCSAVPRNEDQIYLQNQ
jgi:hypothetical protein